MKSSSEQPVAQARPIGYRRLVAAAYWLPALVWVALITYQSLRPFDPGRSHPETEPPDYVLHTAAYFVIGLLLFPACRRQWSLTARAAALIAVLLGMAHGLLDEWLQTYVPGREAQLHDVLTNFLGLVLAQGAILLFRRGRR